MKFLKQFSIILLFSFLGEFLNTVLPLPVPASVYGLLLMLIALMTGICKVDQVKEVSGFLIEIMPIMFIPAAVGLLTAWDVLRPIWVPISIITVVTTVLVMTVTGKVTQFIIFKDRKKEQNKQ